MRFFFFAEQLADSGKVPVPKPVPATNVNKWDGEDEEETVKVMYLDIGAS